MCTNIQIKKIKNMCNPQGVNGAPYVSKLYASSEKDISICIEGGSMKLTTLVDYIYIYIYIYIYMCVCVCVIAVTNAFLCNECNFFSSFFF